MSVETLKIPDIGDVDDVEVIEICVEPGERVQENDPLIVLESDKASMEVPAPRAGTVRSIAVELGARVKAGDVIGEFEAGAAADAPQTAAEDDAAEAPQPAAEDDAAPAPAAETRSDGGEAAAPWAAATASGSRSVDVVIPDIGDVEDVTVVEISVAVGDRVAVDDPIVVLESDKASMEVPSPAAGTVAEILVATDAAVREGDLIARLQAEAVDSEATPAAAPGGGAEGAEPRAAPSAPAAAAAAPTVQASAAAPTPGTADDQVYAGPAVRKLARELNVELRQVRGSGPQGRIVKDDVHAFVRQALARPAGAAAVAGGGIPSLPRVDHEKYGPVDYEPLSRPQLAGATNLHRAWLNVPHVTNHDEADVTELEAFRSSLKAEAEREGVKVTPVAFLIRACVHVLATHPRINASLDLENGRFVLKKHYHIGLAVDTPSGLLVPVLRDADRLGLLDLSRALADLSERARKGQLRPDEMRGGTFTISSLGALGGTGFTPIINPPEVAILGVGRLTRKPVLYGEEVAVRAMLPLSLSYDHRAVNGADAGRFLVDLTAALADVRRLLL